MIKLIIEGGVRGPRDECDPGSTGAGLIGPGLPFMSMRAAASHFKLSELDSPFGQAPKVETHQEFRSAYRKKHGVTPVKNFVFVSNVLSYYSFIHPNNWDSESWANAVSEISKLIQSCESAPNMHPRASFYFESYSVGGGAKFSLDGISPRKKFITLLMNKAEPPKSSFLSMFREGRKSVKLLIRENQSVKNIMYHNTQALMETEAIIGMDYGNFDQKQAFNIVKQVPVLQQSKILGPLGSGAFGTVYKLDNGHVIKLYSTDDEYHDIDAKQYITYLKRTFGSQGSEQDLAVFDMGTFEIMANDAQLAYLSSTGFELMRFYWVELPEIIPLEAWLKRTGRGSLLGPHQAVWSALNVIEGAAGGRHSVALRPGEDYYAPFTDQEARGIYTALRHYNHIIGPIIDFHSGNIGVYPHNPDIWVVFDN